MAVKKEILTEEFSRMVNIVGTHIPDTARAADLDFGRLAIVDHELSPWLHSWRSFMRSLDTRQRKEITTIFYMSARRDMTVGKLRSLPLEEMLNISGMGEKRAIFVKAILYRDEPAI